MKIKKLIFAMILAVSMLIIVPGSISANSSKTLNDDGQSIVEVMPDENLRKLFAKQMGYDSVDEFTVEDLNSISSISVSSENLHLFSVKDFKGIEQMNIDALYITGLNLKQTEKLIKYDFTPLTAIKKMNALYISESTFNNGVDFNNFISLLYPVGSIVFAGNTIMIDKEIDVADYKKIEIETKDWGIKFPLLGIFEYKKTDKISIVDSLETDSEFYIINELDEEYAYIYEEDSHLDSEKSDEAAHIFVPSDTYRFLWDDTDVEDLESLLKHDFTSNYDEGLAAFSFGTGTTYYDGTINYTFDDIRFHLNVTFTHQSNVKVHYVDEAGNQIAEDISLSGKYETPFTLDTKAIDGYTFERIEEVGDSIEDPVVDSLDQTYTFNDREFNIIYSKNPIINKYTVTYTDGVDEEVIFEDQIFADVVENSDTPAFAGTPAREGYTFLGWEPAVAETVTQDALYTAQWEEIVVPVNKYTVTYTDGVDDEVIFEDQVFKDVMENSETPTFVGAPTREGYTFIGWEPTVAETVTENAVYSAQWEEIVVPVNKYTVTYTDGVDDEVIFEDQIFEDVVENSDTPAFVGKPAREGYTFLGWEPAVAETVTQDAVYTAQWEEIVIPINKYTVTYTDGVDEEVIFEDLVFQNVVEDSETPAFVGTPTREGYTFLGWEPAVADTVTENAVYTAQWEEIVVPVNKYTVTYTDGIDDEVIFEDLVFKDVIEDSETPAFAGTPVRESYTFLGWEPAVAETVTQDAVYTAQWEEIVVPVNKYTVTYTDGVDEEVIFEDQVFKDVVEDSETPAFAGTPAREGYKFLGWEPAVAETVTQDALYTAQWEEIVVPVNKFTVTYTDGVDDEVIFEDQVFDDVVENSETPTFTGTPAREGYTFLGWEPAVAETVTENAVYTAQWEEIVVPVNKYTVTYTDGVDDEVIFEDLVFTDVVENSETPAFAGTPVREGYKFLGWEPAVADTVTQDAVYTAQWEEIVVPVNKYTVTYTDGVDDEVIFEDLVFKDVMENSETPTFVGAPTREGYTFIGWEPTVAETVTENAVYSAQWEEIVVPVNKYTVTYTDGVDDEVIFEDQIFEDVVEDSDTPAFVGKPAREGYTFLGWEPAVAETVTENVVYTAQWGKIIIPEVKPEPPVKPEEPVNKTLPKTGINSATLAWSSLLTLSGCTLLALSIALRKKQSTKK
ncbi:InlB B-repeat-containing protein [Vagococcus elongatus]|uniref:MucBP domain-containing protein n=1 Tax=Vagococcus elongatus TaxID=180344 RepID=A0A430ASH9_9ENTE|nr:MucBP domain-containing protein [Vagococcus elongatus]RSU10990.1 hypothetical protein CBF29_08485 [Vagococcus elongatus]